MEKLTPEPNFFERHKVFIKGMIMGFLIIIMIIPTVFVAELVRERKQRQQAIVKEVSSKWSDAQTISGPYLYIPYGSIAVSPDGKPYESQSGYFLILPETAQTNGTIDHQLRKRSIYNVLLYRAKRSR